MVGDLAGSRRNLPCQVKYTLDILERFQMHDCKPLAMLVLCNLPKAEESVIEATSKPLRVLDLALQDSDRDLSI